MNVQTQPIFATAERPSCRSRQQQKSRQRRGAAPARLILRLVILISGRAREAAPPWEQLVKRTTLELRSASVPGVRPWRRFGQQGCFRKYCRLNLPFRVETVLRHLTHTSLPFNQ